MSESVPHHNFERVCQRGLEILGCMALASGVYMAIHASHLQSEQTASQPEIEQYNEGAVDAAVAGIAILSFAGYTRQKASR